MRTFHLPLSETTPKVSRPGRGLWQCPVVLWPSVNLTTFSIYFCSVRNLFFTDEWSRPPSLPSSIKIGVTFKGFLLNQFVEQPRWKLGRIIGELFSSDCQKHPGFCVGEMMTGSPHQSPRTPSPGVCSVEWKTNLPHLCFISSVLETSSPDAI